MTKSVIISVLGLIVGISIGIMLVKYAYAIPLLEKTSIPKQVIGFLPYWQLDKANQNEEKYITELAYFALNVDGDGHIVKLINEQQEEPGWYDLQSDTFAGILKHAKE